jgi:CBS domain-containing protein
MKKLDVGVLPVGEHDKLVGMITDRDIAIRGIAEGKGPDTLVGRLDDAAARRPDHGGPGPRPPHQARPHRPTPSAGLVHRGPEPSAPRCIAGPRAFPPAAWSQAIRERPHAIRLGLSPSPSQYPLGLDLLKKPAAGRCARNPAAPASCSPPARSPHP